MIADMICWPVLAIPLALSSAAIVLCVVSLISGRSSARSLRDATPADDPDTYPGD
jgi:hypothetical protein